MIDFYSKDKLTNGDYAKSLSIIAKLSRLFSDNTTPYLHYRIMENLFCSCFGAKNLSRSDTAYDAKLGTLGIGLKTFICNSDSSVEKIAEFNKDSKNLKDKNPQDLALSLATLRNNRMQLANDLYNIQDSVYHIIARRENKLLFFETDYEQIAPESIKDIKESRASLSFCDDKHEYIFNYSKSVLQRKFYIPEKHHILDIEIANNPFELLLELQTHNFIKQKGQTAGVNYVILPLYSDKGGARHVPLRSGLNQWNAKGRHRSYGEVYIPVPSAIHKNFPNFFPSRDVSFKLKTPDGQELSAKLCQDGAKALMSNPNTALSKWLLKVLQLKEGELATYERMQDLGLDSVIVSKDSDLSYSIDIRPLGSYERFMGDKTDK